MTGLEHVRVVVVGLTTLVTVTVTTVEFVMPLFVPPVPIIATVYMPAKVPVNEQDPVPVPPAARVTEAVHVAFS